MANEGHSKCVGEATKHQDTNHAEFIVPPEACVFYPNKEEFRDPIEYINKIRPIAEKTGICKIIPPEGWNNPFTLNIDKFKFTARIQRLNQLDGEMRLKLNFLDQLSQFWELQGTSLVIPKVEKRQLDLYNLHKLTREHHLTVNKIKWNSITKEMGFDPKINVVSVIKQYFQHILEPYIIFNQLCEIKSENFKFKTEGVKCEEDVILIDSSDEDVKSVNGIKEEDDDDDDDVCVLEENDVKPSVYRELKRLRFLGPGPKMNTSRVAKRRRCSKASLNYEESIEYVCCGCGSKGDESSILLCHGCNDKYHLLCTKPSLPNLPKGKWNCFKCTAMQITRSDDFGFEQTREFTLEAFGEMASAFKSKHFQSPEDLISSKTVEQEYWNLVADINNDVTVYYAADLHVVDHGSGFPRIDCANLDATEREYANSGWNLNNLPVLKRSLLGYINSDVSGMKIPWMYVGMCFATFCWHNEDHWLNSINFLHWGEPKTWYGVPGKEAETLENAWRSALPELFELQPDITHQLVTIINPNILMKANVPVYKLDQQQGEFVITFPRAYHMGFNQGFNFAEAVNFAPTSWFQMGRECVLNYAQMKRFCVFSHDELLCSIAATIERLNPVLAASIKPDMEYVINKEEKLRKDIFAAGITTTQRVELEFMPDDRRHCEICKTTCYLSAVTCGCNNEVLVCLDHYNDLCKCPKSKQILKFRYTIEEMHTLSINIEFVLNSYDEWLEKVENAIDVNSHSTLSDLESLLNQGDTRDYPDCQLHQSLKKAVADLQ